jgi:hypothetical protein
MPINECFELDVNPSRGGFVRLRVGLRTYAAVSTAATALRNGRTGALDCVRPNQEMLPALGHVLLLIDIGIAKF